MRAQEREANQVPSALRQTFSLKINIAAYGPGFPVRATLGLLDRKL